MQIIMGAAIKGVSGHARVPRPGPVPEGWGASGSRAICKLGLWLKVRGRNPESLRLRVVLAEPGSADRPGGAATIRRHIFEVLGLAPFLRIIMTL